MAPTRNIPHKFDPSNAHRAEIESRTAAGETCEQIASALRAKGIDITNKTISRRRVDWGLRKRPFSKLMGTKATKPRAKMPGTKNDGINKRKAEIEARTRRGESAGAIAAALEAQGFWLKKGESTVLRLQTTWGLIEADAGRSRGKRRKGDGGARAKAPASPKVSKREMEREANKQQQSQILHYPTNCVFGPKRRVNGATVAGDDVQDLTMDSPEQSPTIYNNHAPPSGQSNVSVAAEIMSVEFLVDLATSTLGAATNLKDMLLAYQAGRPTSNSITGLPPTLDDLSTARRKVREAAAVMHDLAVDPVSDGAPS